MDKETERELYGYLVESIGMFRIMVYLATFQLILLIFIFLVLIVNV